MAKIPVQNPSMSRPWLNSKYVCAKNFTNKGLLCCGHTGLPGNLNYTATDQTLNGRYNK